MSDEMRDVHEQAEDIAAVMDGTASAAEREVLMRQISKSPELHAAFVEAMAIRNALQAADVAAAEVGAADPVPAVAASRVSASATAPARRNRWMLSAAILLAASLGVVVYVRRAPSAPSRDVLAVAQAMHIRGATGAGSLSRALGTEWDAPTWAVVRGDQSAREHTARAFRAGVGVVQLSAAANANDSLAAGTATQSLRDLLVDSDGSAPIAAQLSDLASRGRFADERVLGVLSAQLRTVLGDSDWFDLGVWTEAARLAAVDNHPEFFATSSAQTAQLTSLLMRIPEPREAWNAATLPLRSLPVNGTLSNMGAVLAALHDVAMRAGS